METMQRLRAALLVAAAVALPPAWADASCAIPDTGKHPMLDRQERLAHFENLPESCLKAMVVDCSTAAAESMLDAGSAASCSIGYEALLKRSFGGNFQKMLAWWRSQRTDELTN